MAISTDYPVPVTVNGLSCKNCSDVANAKRHINPTHPFGGLFGVSAKHRNEAHEHLKSATDTRSIGHSVYVRT